MDAFRLLELLHERRATVRADGEALRIFPASAADGLAEEIRHNKPALLAIVRAHAAADPDRSTPTHRAFDAGAAYRQHHATGPHVETFPPDVPPALQECPTLDITDKGLWTRTLPDGRRFIVVTAATRHIVAKHLAKRRPKAVAA